MHAPFADLVFSRRPSCARSLCTTVRCWSRCLPNASRLDTGWFKVNGRALGRLASPAFSLAECRSFDVETLRLLKSAGGVQSLLSLPGSMTLEAFDHRNVFCVGPR